MAGVTLPSLLFSRREEPVKSYGELPLAISGVYKACRGMAGLSYPLGEGVLDLPLTPDMMAQMVEGSGLLIKEKEVCAAPPAMLLETFKAISSQPKNPNAKSLAGIGIDFNILKTLSEINKNFLSMQMDTHGMGNDTIAMIMSTIQRPNADTAEEVITYINAYNRQVAFYREQMKVLHPEVNKLLGRDTSSVEQKLDVANQAIYEGLIEWATSLNLNIQTKF
jgi:hypothetical protein